MFLHHLKTQLISIPARIRQQFSGMDAGFQMAMLICLGFGATFLPLLITKIQAALIMIIGLLVAIRFLVRPVYRPALADSLHSITGLLWLVFTGMALIAALRIQYAMGWSGDTPFLLVKPLLLLLPLLVWAYMRKTPDEPYARFMPVALLTGMLLFLGLWTLENFKNLLLAWINGPSLSKGVPFYIGLALEKNTAMMLVVPFVFLGSQNVEKNAPPPIWLHVLLALWVLGMSFIVMGAHTAKIMHVGSESVQGGMVITLCIYLMALYWPRATTHLFFTGLMIMLLCSPWIFQAMYMLLKPYLPTLAVPVTIRLELWKAAADEALKAPLFGQGMQYLDYGMGEGLRVFHIPYGFTRDHPHPHNMFLQLWINLGIAGVFVMAGLALSAWRFFLRIPAPFLPSLLAAACLTSLLAMSTHSMWQPYKMGMMALVFLNIYLQGHRAIMTTQKSPADAGTP